MNKKELLLFLILGVLGIGIGVFICNKLFGINSNNNVNKYEESVLNEYKTHTDEEMATESIKEIESSDIVFADVDIENPSIKKYGELISETASEESDERELVKTIKFNSKDIELKNDIGFNYEHYLGTANDSLLIYSDERNLTGAIGIFDKDSEVVSKESIQEYLKSRIQQLNEDDFCYEVSNVETYKVDDIYVFSYDMIYVYEWGRDDGLINFLPKQKEMIMYREKDNKKYFLRINTYKDCKYGKMNPDELMNLFFDGLDI